MSKQSFYFYDLETSGISPRSARVMQFAGQRLTLDLEPIGEPDNVLVKLSEDVLPEPEAVLLTGITPQKTIAEGVSEVEFLKFFDKQVVVPNTIFVGFNNIRFDDEFLRFTRYRNFYDAYDWCWKDDCSRWDMLDVVRLTRALRPAGIEWPYDASGKPSNRLELLTSVNNLAHDNAHDALADVEATIAVARLIKTKQPKLFQYLLQLRTKEALKKLVSQEALFLYTSGAYPSTYHKTSLVTALGDHPKKQAVLVYDLRTDPSPYLKMTATELCFDWQQRLPDETKRFPIKTLQYNRCPAVAPYNVIAGNETLHAVLGLDMGTIRHNHKILVDHPDFYGSVCKAVELMEKQYQTSLVAHQQDVDTMLYDGFFDHNDQRQMSVVRALTVDDMKSYTPNFNDERLTVLYPLYKARNFAAQLSNDEQIVWETYKHTKLLAGGDKSQIAKYFTKLAMLQQQVTKKDAQYLLEELKLYGESIIPPEI